MEILKTWHELFGLRFSPITLIQIGFSAGTVYLLLALQACSGVRVAKKELDHAISHEKLVAEYLHEVGRSWPGANKIVEILKNLVQKKLTPLLDKIPVLVNGAATPEIQEDEYSAPSVIPRSPRQGRVQNGHRTTSKNKKTQSVPNQQSLFSPPSVAVASTSPPGQSSAIPIPVHRRTEPSDSGFVMVSSPGAGTSASATKAEVVTFTHTSHDHSMFKSALENSPPDSVHPSALLYVASHPMEGYADQSDIHNSQPMWPSWYPNIGFFGMPQGQTLPDEPCWNQISIDEQTSPLSTVFDKFIATHPPFISSKSGGPNDQLNAELDTDVSMDELNSWCQSVNQLS